MLLVMIPNPECRSSNVQSPSKLEKAWAIIYANPRYHQVDCIRALYNMIYIIQFFFIRGDVLLQYLNIDAQHNVQILLDVHGSHLSLHHAIMRDKISNSLDSSQRIRDS